ncbi:hypothetical protein D623_10013166 [Myotis brandtii]|uniref:Uncharacterized protein n=1 Tax=Myotis brandtii TaxID=109478 RepID=S7PMV9_MYOBR|nr:hypothetical protein D623_10013166 [Myotis brandtii]
MCFLLGARAAEPNSQSARERDERACLQRLQLVHRAAWRFREIMLNPISLPGHSKPLNHGIYVEDVNVYFSKGRHGF